MSNLDANEEVESNDILQNVNVLSDMDSLADVLSSMGIQSPHQVRNSIILLQNKIHVLLYVRYKGSTHIL